VFCLHLVLFILRFRFLLFYKVRQSNETNYFNACNIIFSTEIILYIINISRHETSVHICKPYFRFSFFDLSTIELLGGDWDFFFPRFSTSGRRHSEYGNRWPALDVPHQSAWSMAFILVSVVAVASLSPTKRGGAR